MPMAHDGLRIAGTPVTEITRDTAQVGCTKVTRAEAEALLKEMDKVPQHRDFEITHESCMDTGSYINFSIRNRSCGWLATSENPNASVPSVGYSALAAFFCLEAERAEKLLKFLVEQLGYVAYKRADKPNQKFIIEYQRRDQPWERTGNLGANGEFDSLESAAHEAEKQEREMGSEYKYRARAL